MCHWASGRVDGQRRNPEVGQCAASVVRVLRQSGIRRYHHHQISNGHGPILTVSKLFQIATPSGDTSQLDEFRSTICHSTPIGTSRQQADAAGQSNTWQNLVTDCKRDFLHCRQWLYVGNSLRSRSARR